MTEPTPPPNFFSLLTTQISEFFSREWKNFQQDLQHAYREDLADLGKSGQTLPHLPSMARASIKVFNKTQSRAQQRFLQLKGHAKIRNRTEHQKKQDT